MPAPTVLSAMVLNKVFLVFHKTHSVTSPLMHVEVNCHLYLIIDVKNAEKSINVFFPIIFSKKFTEYLFLRTFWSFGIPSYFKNSVSSPFPNNSDVCQRQSAMQPSTSL
jgi:hypothetical protein